MISELMAMSRVAGASQTYVDDVFVSFTRTGTGASQTTTTNIDMTKGYALWSKGRSGATDHSIYHSARGVTKDLVTNTTAAETTEAQGLTAVSSTGHTYGTLAKINTNAATYVDWVFRNAPNFYGHQVVVKSGGSNQTALFPELTTLGMVRVKRTDSTGSWYIWHRSLTAGKLLIGETTAAEATLGHITVSGTTVTLVDGVIADGTYLVEAWAHDAGADGIIQCGSFTTDASGNATVNLGWEPQYVMAKQTDGVDSWYMVDEMRNFQPGYPFGGSGYLGANLANAESPSGIAIYKNSTGIFTSSFAASATYIYLTFRRANKPPATGTQVYNAIARTGTGAAATVTGVGFAPDLYAVHSRSGTTGGRWEDRLRGATRELVAETTAAEAAVAQSVTSFGMDGSSIGTDGDWNTNTATYIDHYFKRSPGVVDIVCYTGTGANKTETHNLTKAPELWLVKGRSGATEWVLGSSLIANTEKIVMPSPNGVVVDATAWNSTYPTSTAFSLGTAAAVNTNAATYVAYLWATLAGISKVGTYTGNGSNQTINCGFSTGARFVLIIRTTASTAQDIFIWDTVRGVVAGNDPHLSLNTTVAEVTTDDSIDPDTSGFVVNQLAATNINVTSATYIFLAIA